VIAGAEEKARMDMRLYAEDVAGALRAANRADSNAQIIAKARIAVITKAGNARALLDAVPAEANRDIGYIFSRGQFLRRADQPAEAAEWILYVASDSGRAVDRAPVWIERRPTAGNVHHLGDTKAATR